MWVLNHLNIAFRQLLEKVCQIANVLKSRGVRKGDLVAIYMPICPLAVAAMLACARIGAVHRYRYIAVYNQIISIYVLFL